VSTNHEIRTPPHRNRRAFCVAGDVIRAPERVGGATGARFASPAT